MHCVGDSERGWRDPEDDDGGGRTTSTGDTGSGAQIRGDRFLGVCLGLFRSLLSGLGFGELVRGLFVVRAMDPKEITMEKVSMQLTSSLVPGSGGPTIRAEELPGESQGSATAPRTGTFRQ